MQPTGTVVKGNNGDNDEDEDDDSDDSGSSSSDAPGKKPEVEGAPITNNPNPGLGVLSPAACSGFIASGATSPTAAAISDEEQNSWDESMSESEGSDNEYYDQEDYDDEDVTPPPELQQDGQQQPQEESKDETADAPTTIVDPDQSSTDGEEETGRLVMNVYCTEYDVVQKVGRKVLGFKLKEYKEDHDGAI